MSSVWDLYFAFVAGGIQGIVGTFLMLHFSGGLKKNEGEEE